MSLSHCVTIIHRPTWFFFKSGGTPLLAPTFTSHLNLRLLETPLRPTLDTPLGTTNTARNNCRPGWNDHVDELHQMARDKFVVWVNEGKPRQGLIFNDMKNTLARFKYGCGY